MINVDHSDLFRNTVWFVYSNVLRFKCVGLLKNMLSLTGYIYEEYTSTVLRCDGGVFVKWALLIKYHRSRVAVTVLILET